MSFATPARSYARVKPQKATTPWGIINSVTLCVIVVFALVQYRQTAVVHTGLNFATAVVKTTLNIGEGKVAKVQDLVELGETTVPPLASEKAATLYFTLPHHSDSQYDNFVEVETFHYRPWLFGLEPLGVTTDTFPHFTEDEWLVFEGLGASESHFTQFGEDGVLYTSDVGCAGIFQGCNATCPEEFWAHTKTNIWCGARYFRSLLDIFNGDFELAIAGYKGAFLMWDTDGDGKKDLVVRDEKGNPIIDPDLKWQVDTVWDYVHPLPNT